MNAGVGEGYSEHRARHRIVREIQTTFPQGQRQDTPCESMLFRQVVGCWDLVVHLKPMLSVHVVFHHHKRNRGANIAFSVFAVFQLYGERITVAENHDR